MAHPIVHIEFSAKDPAEAGRFYEQLFGWKLQHDPNLNYTMFDTEAGLGGGFNPLDETTKAGDVYVYVATDDIEAMLTKAESLGGKTVVPKTEIPGQGWFGLFTDPTGNRVGLYTGLMGQG